MSKAGTPHKVERLVAENAQEALRLRLRRMTSATICRRMLATKHPHLAPEAIEVKAEGVASALRSALGYWESSPAALNAKILAQYYFALQLSIAEQVANDQPDSTLEAIQKHTEQGHGLATITAPDPQFPDNYYICAMKSGHFSAYCRSIGFEVDGVAFDARPRNWEKVKVEDRSRFVSLCDLFRRIPELRPVINECLGVPPLSFHVVHSMRNNMGGLPPFGQSRASPPLPAPETATTYVTFAKGFGGGEGVTAEYLSTLGLPLTDIVHELDPVTNEMELVGKHQHPAGELWFESLPLHRSRTGTSLVAPLWRRVADPFIMHFMTLYALSIVVRYLPSVWYEIEHGSLDHIRALLDQYLPVLDVALPQIGIQRIAGIKMEVIYPGSMQSPI